MAPEVPAASGLSWSLAGACLIIVALGWGLIWVAIIFSQTRYVTVDALVSSRSCQQFCTVGLTFAAPDGATGSVTFTGLDSGLIRNVNGLPMLTIFFADRSSETPISPQDYVPLWAGLFIIITTSLPVLAGGVACMRCGLAKRSVMLALASDVPCSDDLHSEPMQFDSSWESPSRPPRP